MKQAGILLLFCLIFIGCKNSEKKEQEKPFKNELIEKSDSETCLFVDGKSYSNLKQKCIELESLTLKLNPLKDGMITSGHKAFVLFDDSKSNAELFLPNSNEGVAMVKTNTGNWENREYKLIAWKGYVLQKNGQAIYGGAEN